MGKGMGQRRSIATLLSQGGLSRTEGHPSSWPGLPSWTEFLAAERRGEITIKWLREGNDPAIAILNYTPKTVYSRIWNPVTANARGLIVCPDRGEIVALPFEAFVKLDGSLGILYRYGGRIRWATRGSFDSPQSRVAQQLWEERYRHHDPLLLEEWRHLTLLVEIIHPATRVVCRYPFSDLVLIAALDRFTGADLPYDALQTIASRLGMPVVERVEGDLEALVERARTLDDNHEGFVLRWPDGYRLKVKGRAYLELHRVLARFTPADQARAWFAGRLDRALPLVPEEFRQEAEVLAERLDREADSLRQTIEATYQEARAVSDGDRGAFARWVQQRVPDRRQQALLFERWKLETPEGSRRLVSDTITHLIENGSLEEVATGEESPWVALFARAERSLGESLWEQTRDRPTTLALRSRVNELPQPLRGPFNDLFERHRPDHIAARAYDAARRP